MGLVDAEAALERRPHVLGDVPVLGAAFRIRDEMCGCRFTQSIGVKLYLCFDNALVFQVVVAYNTHQKYTPT